MKKRDSHNLTLPLFDEEADSARGMLGSWPDGQRFPVNEEGYSVAQIVEADLRASKQPLLITGYASLDRLIDFVASCQNASSIRIVLGAEPFDSRRDSFELGTHSFSREMEHYWLQRGISLLLSAKLALCLEKLKNGQLQARYLAGNKRLHAKIYLAEEAITLGSSNFTYPGFQAQHEANVRFSRTKDASRYQEAAKIAENFWQLGRDYNEALTHLLERLLKFVTWPEALAKACAELLEGDWAREYLGRDNLNDIDMLWPSQRKGIAQALYILDNHGSVLIADATGAGKTRMGANLIGAVRDHNVRSNRLRQGLPVMICPPTVKDSWEREATKSSTPLTVHSHGELSHSRSRGHDNTVDSLRRAQILCVDEGHNFLNMGSARTQQILRNMADHVLLFTATPINKSASDLLRIANMLGADNLDDETVETFKQMLGAKKLSRSLTDNEVELLRTAIRKFTVRRTKSQLNQMVDQEPEKYRDHLGETCRYPKHKAHLYPLNEPQSDREIALQIKELSEQLYAVSHFVKPIEMPAILRQQGVSEGQYLQGRLSSAKKIASYIIMSSLRSSRISLAEHIEGTRKAISDFDLAGFTKQNLSAGATGKLLHLQGKLPINKLSIPLPDWLTDPDSHKAAIGHDWKIYKRIYALLKKMSDAREQTKVDLVIELLNQHHLVLAFDSRPITLAYLEKLIFSKDSQISVLVATGESQDKKKQIIEAFKHGSTEKNLVGLCSDSLAEGVNLQQASVMVHLDMPTVVRVAEQRVGRVDRMDSPHEQIEVWWPNDGSEFAILSDERFIERYETVENLLGSNMPLPDGMGYSQSEPVEYKKMLQEFERQMAVQQWDGITDAFESVRALVEGESSLMSLAIYEQYRHVSARVLSRVSLVSARSQWSFFCLSAGSFATPRWLMLPSFSARPLHDLSEISTALRERLSDAPSEALPMDANSTSILEHFIRQLPRVERVLLPRRKQRALEQLESILESYIKKASAEQNQERLDAYCVLLDAVTKPLPDFQPNWDELASRWLDLIRPIWYEKLHSSRIKLLLLKDIKKDLIAREDTLGPELIEAFSVFPRQQNIDERIIACIIGVPV
ncbi:SNF2-related protein [Methylophaga lonarensis]|uniref:SNF2-related protein n=1 Tax=Methylophaga lonarensis TaxID=999151 RepID=UPI003D293115